METLAAAPSTRLSRFLTLGDAAPAQSLSAIGKIAAQVPDSGAVAALARLTQGLTVGGITVPEVATGVQGGVSNYDTWIAEPAERAAQAETRAEIVAQWSMPLMHAK